MVFALRQDGVQEFYVDKALVKEYREVSEQRFQNMTDDDRQRHATAEVARTGTDGAEEPRD